VGSCTKVLRAGLASSTILGCRLSSPVGDLSNVHDTFCEHGGLETVICADAWYLSGPFLLLFGLGSGMVWLDQLLPARHNRYEPLDTGV
jgi:hypothetical protein